MPELLRAYVLAAGLAENEAGVERLGETLTPTLNIWERPEWALLRGETLWVANRVVTAGGAGTMAGVAICNPVGSGIVTVVEKAQLNVAVAGAVIGVMMLALDSLILANFGNTAQVHTRDRRKQTTGQTLVRYGNTIVGLLAGTEVEYQPAVTVVCRMVNLPVPLYAGQGLLLQTNDDASAISAHFSGYERKCVLNEARGG